MKWLILAIAFLAAVVFVIAVTAPMWFVMM